MTLVCRWVDSMYEIVSKEFVDFINQADLSETKTNNLYRDILARLADMAAFLYVGRAEITHKIKPNIFDLKGETREFPYDFSNDIDKSKPAIRMK